LSVWLVTLATVIVLARVFPSALGGMVGDVVIVAVTVAMWPAERLVYRLLLRGRQPLPPAIAMLPQGPGAAAHLLAALWPRRYALCRGCDHARHLHRGGPCMEAAR